MRTTAYGSWIDLCAPYGPYVSTWGNQGFATVIGTSYSTALVSGLLGVLMANYGWPRDKAIAIVLASARNIDTLNLAYAGKLGKGCVDANIASSMTHEMFLPIIMH